MTDSDPLDGLRTGIRVVVRHRLEHGVTDALGDLVGIDADTVSVRTRRGVVVINRAAVVAAKEVPPRSTRRGAAHLAVSRHDLERIMVEGWPPLERADLGGWLLRAASGFTGRANSVLPLGDPGMPWSQAVDHCERWYVERGLRCQFSLFGPTGFALAEDPLAAELLGRGYEPFTGAEVLTAATQALPSETPDSLGAHVLIESTPSQAWWETWAAWDARVTPAEESDAAKAARAVLCGSPEQLFASLHRDGAVVGVARVAFAHAWAGVSALQVASDHRREGVASQLVSALADTARARGIRSMYLQVAHGNSPARGLFTGLGFSIHHEYRYLGR